MEHFAAAGLESHAISLRGTAGSPTEPAVKSVRISQHVDDIRCFVDEVCGPRRPVLVGHSFGGATCLKYLEAGGPASGVALLCSVPPSGNGAMTWRFFRRSLRAAWLITKGFALKTATRDAGEARALFFDEALPEATLAGYLPRFEADSRVGLDLGDFTQALPSACADAHGRALWSRARDLPSLVLGAEQDAVVDREGVEEAGVFLGCGSRLLPGLPHDVMLCSGWRLGADEVVEWVRRERCRASV